jgi:hypothetical protein
MATLRIVSGTKENLVDDLHALTRKGAEQQKTVAVTGKDIRGTVLEKVSELFSDNREVLVLVDPEREVLEELSTQIGILKERIEIIIYTTVSRPDIPEVVGGTSVPMQSKEMRIRETIRSHLRKAGKKMTEKAFHSFIEKVKDAGLLEGELAKLIAYTGSKQTIDSKDLETVMAQTDEEKIWSLFDALAAKDKKKTMETFDHLVSQGEPLLKIHSELVKQIRLLLHAKDMEDFSRARLEYKTFGKTFGTAKNALNTTPKEKKHYFAYQSPGYAFNLLKRSSKFSKQELISFLERLASFDKQVKKGTTRHERFCLESVILGA